MLAGSATDIVVCRPDFGLGLWYKVKLFRNTASRNQFEPRALGILSDALGVSSTSLLAAWLVGLLNGPCTVACSSCPASQTADVTYSFTSCTRPELRSRAVCGQLR